MADDELHHYGVKGMRWGHRKKEELVGDDRSSSDPSSDPSSKAKAEYVSLTNDAPKRSGRDASKKLAENQKKLIGKFDDPSPPSRRQEKADRIDSKAAEASARIKEIDAALADIPRKGATIRQNIRRNQLRGERAQLREERKQYNRDAGAIREGKLTSNEKKAIVAIGVGALVVGVGAHAVYKQKAEIKALEKRVADGDLEAKLELYNKQMNLAKINSWMMGDYIQKSSWDREEFELPAGHVFNRLSTSDETGRGFRQGTYCTASEADLNRYVAGFRHELGSVDINHVTFTATKPIKVPNLTTAVETMREVMQKEQYGMAVSRSEALARYQQMSGGSWDDLTSQNFFESLKAKGYGAIVDEMDAGVIGDRPLVFFDYGNASEKQSRRMSEGEIFNRERAIDLMEKPPRKG